MHNGNVLSNTTTKSDEPTIFIITENWPRKVTISVHLCQNINIFKIYVYSSIIAPEVLGDMART